MGSVSMQSQASSRDERLSALIDGEWAGEPQPDGFLSGMDHQDKAAWSHYHLIGDVLRSDELAMAPAASSTFLRGFAARLEAEPHVLAPAALGKPGRLATTWRRRMVPGVAVAAAAAALSWIVVPQLQGGSGVAQVASSSVRSQADAPLQRVAMASMPAVNAQPAVQDANFIRDARLDEYLEAHQQFAQQSAMPDSMPLMRAALTSRGQ